MRQIFISLLLCISCGKNLSQRDLLVGFWAQTFPVPSVSYGYVFDNDGRFYYWHDGDMESEMPYSGSMGKWEIHDNNIVIYMEYDLLWTLKLLPHMMLGFVPGPGNKQILVKRNKPEWISIGDIRTYTGMTADKPAKVMLATINRSGIKRSEIIHWKLCKNIQSECDDWSRIAIMFNKLLQYSE